MYINIVMPNCSPESLYQFSLQLVKYHFITPHKNLIKKVILFHMQKWISLVKICISYQIGEFRHVFICLLAIVFLLCDHLFYFFFIMSS